MFTVKDDIYQNLLYDFWENFNDKTGIQYFDAVDFGLEPRIYNFLKKSFQN